MKKIIFYFLSSRALALIGVILATLLLPLNRDFTAFKDYALGLPYYVWIWGNFDGVHYLDIATRGYQNLEYPFFPLLPLIIRGLFEAFDLLNFSIPYISLGVIISNISFLISLFVIWKILTLDNQKKLLSLLLLIIVTFPTSFFYGAVYNDSLFFLLASLTLLFSRRRNFLLAGAAGALATFTRLNGLALLFLILFEYFSSQKENEHWKLKVILRQIRAKFRITNILQSKIYAVLFIPLAFAVYLFYVQMLSGSFMELFNSMRVWNQNELTFPLQVVYRYFKIFLTVSPSTLVYWVAVFEFVSVLFYLAMLAFSFKKIRLSYWVFFAVSILIPALTGTFAGMPRYGLHIYPFFLSIALFLKNKPLTVKALYFIISLGLFLFAITLFTRGYFVS